MAQPQKSARTVSPALAALQGRVKAAQAARQSGNPEEVAQANRGLIAVALRQMAHLRLLEGAFAPSAELYRRSVDFEDLADTHVDLAVVYLRARKPDEALTEAAKAILATPENARGWHIQGKAWMMKQDYAKAADSLSRAVALRWDPEAAYSLSICLLNNHEKEKAVAVFQKMQQAASSHLGTLHVLFARAYRDAGYLPDAVRELNTALKIDPKTPHAHYFLGLVYLLEEEWAPKPRIREQFLAELQLNPRAFLSNYLLGVMDSLAKDYEESDHYLKIASEIDPSWPGPWLYLGLNASGRGDDTHAEEYLRKAIALTGTQESRSNYMIRKGYFALGRILSRSGKREEAVQYAEKARKLEALVLEEGRKKMDAHGAPGGSGMGNRGVPDLVDKTQEEEEDTRELATVDPTAQLDTAALSRANLTDEDKQRALDDEKWLRTILGASLNDLATSEAIQQKYALALQHYQEAQRWDPQLPGLARNLGVAAVRSQNYREAVQVLPEVLAANPSDNTIRAMLGMSYYMTDDYNSAARTIAPLGDGAIKDHGLAYAWADSLVKQNEVKPAAEVLDKLDKESLSADTLMMVGRLWEEIGNHMRAGEDMRRLLEVDPSRPKAHYYAGLAYLKAGRPAEAATEFQAELALNPNDTEAKYNLGFVSLQQAQREKAAALFREVVAANPEDAQAQYQLGKMLLDDGKAKEAVPYLEEAARLSPKTDYVHYQLQAAYRKEARIADAEREMALYKELKAKNREQTAPRPNPNQ
jgi:tetratricopeptide (TPR) repeat protein